MVRAATGIVPVDLASWRHGMVTRDAAHLIPDTAVVDLKNIRPSPGELKKRNGHARVNATSLGTGAIRGLFERGSELLAAWGTALYAESAGTLTSVGAITAGGTLQRGAIHQATGNLYFFDGTLYKTYNGTAVSTQAVTGTAAGSIPTCKSLTNYLGRIWATGDATESDALFASDADAPTVFNTGTRYRFRTATGDDTIACYQWIQFVVLFKERSTHLMVFSDPGDTATWRQRPLFSLTGCTSGLSIVEDPNGTLYWVSKKGIHRLRPGEAIAEQPEAVRISDPIQPTFDALTTLTDANAEVEGNYIRFHFPTDAKTLVYRWDQGIWAYDTGYLATCHLLRANGHLVYGDKTNGIVFKYDSAVWNDDNNGSGEAAVSYRVLTKDYDWNALLRDKALLELAIRGEEQTATSTATVKTYLDGIERLNETIDFNQSFTINVSEIGDASISGSAAPLVPLSTTKIGRGKTIQWEITNAVIDEPITVYGIHLTARLLHPRVR